MWMYNIDEMVMAAFLALQGHSCAPEQSPSMCSEPLLSTANGIVGNQKYPS